MLGHGEFGPGFSRMHQYRMVPLNGFLLHRFREDNLVFLCDERVRFVSTRVDSGLVDLGFLSKKFPDFVIFFLTIFDFLVGQWEIVREVFADLGGKELGNLAIGELLVLLFTFV